MGEPIRDAGELGAIAYDAGFVGSYKGWDHIDEDHKSAWRECAAAVRSAVCPPGYRVVPAAEHDATLALILAAVDEFAPMGMQTPRFHELMGRLTVVADTYQSALAKEPTDG